MDGLRGAPGVERRIGLLRPRRGENGGGRDREGYVREDGNVNARRISPFLSDLVDE